MACGGCSNPIKDRYFLSAIGSAWHDDCLKCACCGGRLAELGWTFYYRKGMTLCKRDYIRLFGVEGQCSVCSKTIGLLEWVMHAGAMLFHLQCFACQECNGRFCVGDPFRIDNKGRLLCQEDYDELTASKAPKG